MIMRCVVCGKEYPADEIIYTCNECGSVLEVLMETEVSKKIFEGRKWNMWRYKEFLPVDESKKYHLMKEVLHL